MTGIEAALIISSVVAAGAGVASAQINKPDFPDPPAPPSAEEIAAETQGRKKKIVRSQIQAAQRLAALGPIQLEAPTLGV